MRTFVKLPGSARYVNLANITETVYDSEPGRPGIRVYWNFATTGGYEGEERMTPEYTRFYDMDAAAIIDALDVLCDTARRAAQ